MEENSSSNKGSHYRARKVSTINTESDPILLLHLLRTNAFIFISIIVSCVFISLVYLRYSAPIYSANLVYQINTENRANTLLNVNSIGGENSQNNKLAKDVEVLRSKFLFKRALKRLPLEVSYFNEGDILTNELYVGAPVAIEYQILDSTILNQTFSLKFTTNSQFQLILNEKILGEFNTGEDVKLEKVVLNIIKREAANQEVLESGNFLFRINNYETLTNQLNSKLSVYPLNAYAKTINISFKDGNAKKAADIVTAIAEEYMMYDIEARSKGSKSALQFIDNQLDRYYNKLKVSENKIKNFHIDNKFGRSNKSSVFFDRTVRLENELIDVELQISILKEIKHVISTDKKELDVYELLPVLTGTEYEEGIKSDIENLKSILIEKENLQFKVTGNSDLVKLLDYKIEIQTKILLESIHSVMEKLELKRDNFYAKTKELQGEFESVPELELEYARLQRVLSIDENFYTMLIQRRTEYSISNAGFVSKHTILDKAVVPRLPIYPNKNLFIGSGFAIGMMLSILLLLIKYILKNTVSSIDDIIRHSFTDLTVLGIVPKYKKDIPVSHLVVDQNPKSVIAEAFRSIRSNLNFIDGSEGKKVIAITSTVSGEGKTFCAINIAGIIAFSGKKVVIIDLDMRKPKIHIGFAVENDFGMSNLLSQRVELEDCIRYSELENLDFITSGPIPPNPSELIINGEIDKIITKLKESYDFIIIDNPPVGLVSDAMELLKKADYPIYVFKNEYSQKNFVHNVDRLILDNGISKLSVILNAVEQNRTAYGYGNSYGYGSSYGYGYGYGYGGYYEDEPKEKKGIFSYLFKKDK